MLTNPYNPSGVQWESNHTVQARVSQEDFYFLKRKFPYYPGLVDKVISTIYKKVLDELRRIDLETPFDTALYIDDESYNVLDDVITRLQVMERRTIGDDSVGGAVAAQHDAGGIDSIHPEVQRPEIERPVKEGRTKTRKRRPKGSKKKEIQR
jgi:hypothetical protein